MKMQSLSKVLITVLCLLLFVLPVCAVDYIGDINYAPSAGSDPGIGIISDTPIPVFGAGDYAVLEIPIKSSAPYTAFDVVGHITTEGDKLPFEFENMSPFSKSIMVFFDIPTKIVYDIFVPEDVPSGTYPINIDISYGDMYSSTYTKNLVFYVRIENESFDVTNHEYVEVIDCKVPEKAERDTSAEAEITVSNISGIKLNKTSVEIVLPSCINISNDTSVKGASLEKDSDNKFKYRLRVAKNADAGDYPIVFNVKVFDKDNTTVLQELSYNSVITIPDNSYDNEPSIEITDVKIPENIKPGDTFAVSVTYKNSGNCRLDYIKTSITADISAETFVNKSATSHLVQSLEAGESFTKDYVFTAALKAKGEYYDLKFDVSAKYDVSDTQQDEISATQYSGFNIIRESDNLPPYTVTGITIPESISPDEEFSLTFTVNVNKYTENLNVSAALPVGIINTTPAVFWYDVAQPGSVFTHEIKLKCGNSSEEGYGEIKISVNSEGGTEILQYTGTYINGSDDDKAYFSISDITLPTSVDVSAQSEFDFTFTLTCLNADDEDVSVDVILPVGIINRTQSKFYIGDMKKGESVTKTVKLFATDEAKDGFANIEIAVTSKDTERTGQYTGISVNNVVGDKDEMPVVIINEYDYGSEYVLGGSTFPLKLNFMNTSTVGRVKDLKITLASDEDGVFTPAASSNTYFVQELAPGQSVDWNLDIQTKSDINPQSYGLIINISYKNENGTEKSDVETLTIPVRQEMRFNISDSPVINDISMNEDAILSLNCANLGKSTVYNVLIKIQGNFSSTEYEIFAGNIEAGKGYSSTVYLTPMMEGMQEGTVTYQYEDADGVVMTEEKTIMFNAYSMDNNFGMMTPMDPFEEMPTDIVEEQSEGLPSWFWYAVAGAGVVVCVVVILVVVKIVRRKKKEYDDED